MMRKRMAIFSAIMITALILLWGSYNGSVFAPVLQADNIAEHPSTFYYNQLTDKEKIVYCKILNQVSDFQTTVSFRDILILGESLSQETVWKIERCFGYDHPEYYWLSNSVEYQRKNGVVTITYDKYNPSEIKETYAQLQAILDEMICSIPSHFSDYEKAKFLYNALIERFSYDIELSNSGQDIREILQINKGVCAGYAYVYKVLCDKAGIPCIVAVGASVHKDGSQYPHIWNAVELDGKWHWVDVTWGDVSGKPDNFFCVGDDEFFEKHRLLQDSDIINNNSPFLRPMGIEFPQCDGIEN